MIKQLLTVFILVLMFQANGQSARLFEIGDSLSAVHQKRAGELSTPFLPNRKDLYLDKSWDYYIMYTNDGEVVPFSGRINVTRNFLEAKVENRIRRINESEIALLINGKNKYLYVPMKSIEGAENSSFVKVLSVGKVTLVERYVVDIRVYLGNSLNPQVDSQEVPVVDSDLYYTTDFKTYKPMQLRKNDVLDVLADKSDKIELFMEVNNLKLKTNWELLNIFTYYNGL